MQRDIMNKEFLILTFLSNTQAASFQHGNVYEKSATNDQKQNFQKDFHKELRALEPSYMQRVSDEDHIRTVKGFADKLTKAHSATLADGELRIGTAQKAVNLFLKFLWSIEVVPEPPHCPIDRTVLTAIKRPESWTQIESIEEYKSIIDDIRQHAKRLTPAQTPALWELDLWNRMPNNRGNLMNGPVKPNMS